MFQFSRVTDKNVNPETYFRLWQRWFTKFGIKTEIREGGRGWALFREGKDYSVWENSKKYKKGTKCPGSADLKKSVGIAK